MLALSSLIIFDDFDTTGSLELDFCNNIEIEKSRKTLTNTCKITLPRNMLGLQNYDINKRFLRPGLKVTVSLGYDGVLVKEFTGYIAKVSFKIPVEIICEDEMWHLKQNSFTRAFPSVSLKELIKYVYTGTARVSDLTLGSFVIKQQSTAQVLEALKKFGVQCYFDTDGVLVAEFAGSISGKRKEVLYDFNTNVIDNDLEYKRKEDIRIKVKGISKLPDGKKIEVFFGDQDGDERTLNFVNLDKAALFKIVQSEFDKLKQDGLTNSFTTFGMPYAEPGDIAIINDDVYPERNGSYLIESVKTLHGVNGFRRVITPERKLA